MKRTILAAVIAAAVLAPDAHAQISNPIHVGVSGGISFPVSNAAEGGGITAKSNSGYNVAGHLGFQVPLFPVGLRADVGYNKFTGKDFNLSGVTGHADVGVFSGTLNAIIKPAGLLPVRPYFIGGIGAYSVKHEATVTSSQGTFSVSPSKTSFGLNGGAGIQFGLGSLSTFLEARYHYVMNKDDCNSSSAASDCVEHKNTTFVPVSFGIMF